MTESALAGRIPTWTIGDRLRKAREMAGLKADELAAEIGIGRNTISNYETGRTPPKRPNLVAWAMRTGVDLTWLQTGQVIPAPRDGDGGWAPTGSNRQPAD